MTICFTLLFPPITVPETNFTSVKEKASPETTSSAGNTCCDKIKQKRKKKKDILFIVGSLHHSPTQADTYHTHALYTSTHSCTHHFVKLHISKQVPLFISALTEPHTQIESTVTAYPYLLFVPFQIKPNYSANFQFHSGIMLHSLKLICFQPMCLIHFFLHNDFAIILHHTSIETPSFHKNISVMCIYFH